MSDFGSVFDRANPKRNEPIVNANQPAPVVEFWARVELMGHRVRYGHIREVEMFGAKLMRVDIHNSLGCETEFYGGSAIYCVRPISEEDARKNAEPYKSPAPARLAHHQDDIDDYEDDNPF